MSHSANDSTVHPWLRTVDLSRVPGPGSSPVLEAALAQLVEHFRRAGHRVRESPDRTTRLLLTTAPFGEPIGWREAPLFTARRRFGLAHSPTVFTFVHARRLVFEETLDRLRSALTDEPRPEAYQLAGLAPEAYRVLHEQGLRGGPILALVRLVQAQSKSIRVVLFVGDDQPELAYHFDLAGAHPTTEAGDGFYHEIMLRIVTAVSTEEVTEHHSLSDPIPRGVWSRLSTPRAMTTAGEELGRRDFFTEPVEISRLVRVPAANDAVASQYSEGCYATWDPEIRGLVTTVTGSARPVHKGHITEDELAVIVGVREDGRGALVQPVEGRDSTPASSEAVEMIGMDGPLPRIRLDPTWGVPDPVPVIRSKLHGHRGVAAFDPNWVEYVSLDSAYFRLLVSCASAAQAEGVIAAFARSEALSNPEDPRQIAFSIIPGHGVVIAEKWVEGKAPFQTIWEHIDNGSLQIESPVPQGPLDYLLDGSDLAVLRLR